MEERNRNGYWLLLIYTVLSIPVFFACNPSRQLTKALRHRNVYALIVGVNDYKRGEKNDLNYTISDAKKLSDYIMEGCLGRVIPGNIVNLYNEDARRNNILYVMDTLFTKAGKDDLVLFFFSGHGSEGAFVPYDFIEVIPSTLLSHRAIQQRLRKSKAGFKFIIADACLSGSMQHKPTANKAQLEDTLVFRSTADVAVLMSSRAHEFSVESAELQQGVFSHYFLRGLMGEADCNRDRTVTIEELFLFTRDSTFEYVRDHCHILQSPILYGKFSPDMPVANLPKKR